MSSIQVRSNMAGLSLILVLPIFCFFMFASANAASDIDRTEALEQVERLASTIFKALEIPGAHLSIGYQDEIIYSGSFGVMDVQTRAEVTAETLFRTASVAKAVTGTLLARLSEMGKIDLDEPISEFHPDLADFDKGITLRLLAGHLGGIRHYMPKDDGIDERQFSKPQDILSIFSSDPLVADPGTKHRYSTFGFSLISVAVELKTGQTFEELLFEHVSAPLNLENTLPDYPNVNYHRKTKFYERRPGEGIGPADSVFSTYKYAGGGLLSTPDDLVRLGMAILSDRFLSPAMRRTVFTPQKTKSGTNIREGLAWRIGEDLWGNQIVHHAGSMSGARSIALIYPDSGIVVSIMTNLSTNPYFIEQTVQFIVSPLIRESVKFFFSDTGDADRQAYNYEGTFVGAEAEGSAEIAYDGATISGFVNVASNMNKVSFDNGFIRMDRYPILGRDRSGSQVTIFLLTPFGIMDIPFQLKKDEIILERRIGQISLSLHLKPAVAN